MRVWGWVSGCGVQKLCPPEVFEREAIPAVVKLNQEQIALICREAARGWASTRPITLAKRYGVTTRHIRRLAQRQRETGQVPQLNPNRRPRSAPLTSDEKDAIDAAREKTMRGARKAWIELRRQGIRIPKHKVHAHFKAKRYSKPNPRKQKKRKRCRYERQHSGSLIHGDWHQTTEAHPYVIAWQDDASRKVLAAGEFDAISTDNSILTLDLARKSAALYGLDIQQANTDQGSEFFNVPRKNQKRKPGRFTRHLAANGIEHVPSRRNNPQTNGKLERFWYEYDRHRWRFDTLEEFLCWNNDQVHDELWIDDKLGIYEVPDEAFERKLPPETLLLLHHRLVTEAAS